MIDLTPLDVRNKIGDFRRIMRGYDPLEVDPFIEQVADRLEELVREVVRLRERCELLEAQVAVQEEREGAVKEALVTAQQLREDVKSQAEREAAVIVREAEVLARERVGEIERELRAVRASLEEMKRRRMRFLKSFRMTLERELDVVDLEAARDFAEAGAAGETRAEGELRSTEPTVPPEERVTGAAERDGNGETERDDAALAAAVAPADEAPQAGAGEDKGGGLWLSTILKDEREEEGGP